MSRSALSGDAPQTIGCASVNPRYVVVRFTAITPASGVLVPARSEPAVVSHEHASVVQSQEASFRQLPKRRVAHRRVQTPQAFDLGASERQARAFLVLATNDLHPLV